MVGVFVIRPCMHERLQRTSLKLMCLHRVRVRYTNYKRFYFANRTHSATEHIRDLFFVVSAVCILRTRKSESARHFIEKFMVHTEQLVVCVLYRMLCCGDGDGCGSGSQLNLHCRLCQNVKFNSKNSINKRPKV